MCARSEWMGGNGMRKALTGGSGILGENDNGRRIRYVMCGKTNETRPLRSIDCPM